MAVYTFDEIRIDALCDLALSCRAVSSSARREFEMSAGDLTDQLRELKRRRRDRRIVAHRLFALIAPIVMLGAFGLYKLSSLTLLFYGH